MAARRSLVLMPLAAHGEGEGSEFREVHLTTILNTGTGECVFSHLKREHGCHVKDMRDHPFECRVCGIDGRLSTPHEPCDMTPMSGASIGPAKGDIRGEEQARAQGRKAGRQRGRDFLGEKTTPRKISGRDHSLTQGSAGSDHRCVAVLPRRAEPRRQGVLAMAGVGAAATVTSMSLSSPQPRTTPTGWRWQRSGPLTGSGGALAA